MTQPPSPKLHDLINLTGKVAVVTGAGRGIGAAAAFRFAEAGAHVAVLDLNEGDVHATVAGIREAGGSAEPLVIDVTDSAAVAAGIERVGNERGKIDILVNNAAIYPMRSFMDTNEELWRKTLDVNVLGIFRCVKSAVPFMEKAGGGVIVNLASIAGLHPEGELPHYETSKGAVIQMTRSLAWELRDYKIRVNTVAPGGIQTPGARMSIEPLLADPKKLMARSRGFFARLASKRMGESDDVARAIFFMGTPLSEYCNGSLLVVDGGFLCG